MVSKKGWIYILLIIALVLALFSIGMTMYVNNASSSSQSLTGDLGGNVNLVVLPSENTTETLETG